MNKTLVIDLRVVGKWFGLLVAAIGFAALIGLPTGAFWYHPSEALELQRVVLADGQTAIEITCRDAPGSYMRLFGTTEGRVAKYYSLDGGNEWLLEDFGEITVDPIKNALRSFHRQWLLSHKPQVLQASPSD